MSWQPRTQRVSAGRLWTWIVVGFLLLPVLLVIPLSFSDSRFLQFPPPGWSLRWYEELVENEAWRSSLITSLQVAVLASVIATAAGLGASMYMLRCGPRLRSIVRVLVILPLVTPLIVIAVGQYEVLSRMHLIGFLPALAASHALLGLPFASLILFARLSKLNPHLERAAWTLGASRLRTFWRITVPLLGPAIGASLVTCFLVSFDEIVIALFLSGPGHETLPVLTFSYLRSEVTPVVAAVSTLLIAATAIVVILSLLRVRVFNRSDQAREAD